MIFARSLLATVLAGLLAAPSWCASNPVVGTAGPSDAASVRGAGLLPGATLFNGDLVEVGARGDAALSFGRGAMARLGADTTLRLEKSDSRVALELLRGRVAFRSSAEVAVEAQLADARIVAANGQPAVGVMAFRSSRVVVVTAERGALLVRTAHDARSATLREGESLEMRLESQDDRQGGERREAGTSAPGLSRGQWLTIAIISGIAAIAAGYAIGELALSNSQKSNLVSPFQFPPN